MTSPTEKFQWKTAISWSLYDAGNSAFATTIMAAFFPALYGTFWNGDAEKAATSRELLIAGMVASVIVAVMAPIMGSIADRSGMKKPFLAVFATLGVFVAVALPFVPAEGHYIALGLYGIGMLAFLSGNVFYDALLVDSVPKESYDYTSGLGFSLGYLSGGILLLINLLMVSKPEMFGLESKLQASLASMFCVSIWWAVLSVPIFLFVKERKKEDIVPLITAAKQGIQEIVQTVKHVFNYKLVIGFLIAYVFYIDGVSTLMKIAVKYGTDLGFGSSTLLVALLVVQFVGFPMALFFGYLGKHIGAKNGILICIVVYAIATLGTLLINAEWHLYAFACAIGCVQGGVQSLSRSLFASIIPQDKAGEFFGFYNMLGKFSAILGPTLITASTLLMGFIGLESGLIDRLTILPLLLLFGVGGTLLFRLKFPKVTDTGL